MFINFVASFFLSVDSCFPIHGSPFSNRKNPSSQSYKNSIIPNFRHSFSKRQTFDFSNLNKYFSYLLTLVFQTLGTRFLSLYPIFQIWVVSFPIALPNFPKDIHSFYLWTLIFLYMYLYPCFN